MKSFLISFLLFSILISQKLDQSFLTITDTLSSKKPRYIHLTPHLLEIAKNGQNLSINKRIELESIGFNFNSPLVSRGGMKRSESDGLDRILDIDMFRFHYTITGYHSVNSEDLDNNDIPDYVDSIAKEFKNIKYIIHDQMGYLKPPSDGYYSSSLDKGGSNHYDIYIRNLSSRYYGYVQPEEYAQGSGDNEQSGSLKELNAFTSYMAIRNNYFNFPLEQLESIKVTLAHEYYHAIQFGYDGWEKPWLLESSAVWMEEEIYDEINDCYQYMKEWFDYPNRSLDESGYHWYGSFIFFEYLEQHMGGNRILKEIMDESANLNSREKDGSHLAIDNALKKYGFSFQQAINGMSIANIIMSSSFNADKFSYEEAESYPVEGPTIFSRVNFELGTIDTIISTGLARFGSEYIEVTTRTPIQIDLINTSGPISDLQMNSILKRNDDSYLIISSPAINIDPLNFKSIRLSIVSQDSIKNNWDYKLIIKDGKLGTDSNVPRDFNLTNPYPNPFNGSIKFSVYMLKDARVSINIINHNGQRVKAIHNGQLNSGNHYFNWHGKNESLEILSSGVYYIKVSSDSNQDWRKVTFIK